MQPLSNVDHLITCDCLVTANFENMRFLGPHSDGEVPISLKIVSSLGPHFDKFGSPWHVASVQES